MKYAIGIEYDGTRYVGWQTQQGGPSIQSTLQQALSQVAAEPTIVHGAGRTDKGVHATQQVAHFETNAVRESKAWVMGVNMYLPSDIRILWVQSVPDSFHARFAALSRRYHYIIYNHPTHSAILRHAVSWHYHPLNASLMDEAIQYLVGEHDFASFRAASCQAAHGIREIFATRVWRQGHFVIVDIQGNAFLHHMVRNIVGALLQVGRQEQAPQWIEHLLQLKDRKQAGVTAPPQGLYLTQIQYPLETVPQTCRLPCLLADEGVTHG